MVDVTDPTRWPGSDCLSRQASIAPDELAVVDADTDREWTYAEVDAWADRLAAALVAAGLSPDDRLGLCLESRPVFATLYFAAVRVGAVVVPLHTDETAREYARTLERTEPAVVVCESTTRETVAAAAECPVVSVDGDGQPLAAQSAREKPPVDATAPRDVDATQLLVCTSGTGGEPKIVCLSRRNLLANATASAFRLGVEPGDRWLCCLPMAHMGGLAPIVRTVLYGSTLVTQRRFEPATTLTILDDAISCVSLVPTMCRRLLDAGWEPTDALRVVLLGGGPASETLLEQCVDRGIPVHPTYGATETAAQIATARPAEAAANPGTVGRPLACQNVRIVDDDGRPVEPGEAGEVVVSGPAVADGYLEAGSFTDSEFATGDLGRMDQAGRLWITGRLSDRIITGGENVDPAAVVAVLKSHPAVDDCAVVGLADPEWGERVAALLVTDGADFGSVRAHCERELAGYKRPKTVAVTDRLPRTASGTVDREAVRSRLRHDGVSFD